MKGFLMLKAYFYIIGLSLALAADTRSSGYTISTDSIFKHISILASDSMEGREVGEPGELKAAQYIASIFMASGLTPKGDNNSWFQYFEFTKGTEYGQGNTLLINGKLLRLHEEYVPLLQSSSGVFVLNEVMDLGYGINSGDGQYNDYDGKSVEGKPVLIRRYAPSADSFPHVDFDKFSSLTDKIATAIDNKVSAIFFVTPLNQDDTIPSMAATRIAVKEIPIIWLKRAGLKKLGLDLQKPKITRVSGNTDLVRVKDTGMNVIGFIQGKSDSTVIVGGHYDHLGWGNAASRYTGTEHLIHYGADDNASGTAGVLELSRYFIQQPEPSNYSLLFIAFSGEETGILGSNHFAKNMTVAPDKIRMMLNMDMIGRLKVEDSGLGIFGTGTAEAFKTYFATYSRSDMKMTFKETGTGPSDHTAFYNASIPVLFFFTGQHEDYHKPSDIASKINLEGTRRVLGVVTEIISHFDSTQTTLAFQKTKDETGQMARSFSVTLGIMPDYIAEVVGLRVDGVSANRPAERAGILRGDVIIKLGDYKIDDINAYMSALGKFRKGQSTQALVIRENDTLNLKVEFK
ncbi:MAG: M28 family peptidase [candidate division Zixibacteria bacterium]|nr:M28 family peptidase [candidate division Zixibacteria bacterium]